MKSDNLKIIFISLHRFLKTFCWNSYFIILQMITYPNNKRDPYSFQFFNQKDTYAL